MQSVEPKPLPKEVHARYEVLQLLGQGGMGIVYEAIDRENGAKVALKILKSEIAEHAETADRFKTELLLARKITHKNVCRVFDMSRFGGLAVIAMEYVEGESLRARLNRAGHFALPQVLEIAGQIMNGLEEAHHQSVIHRDLKPDNIMIAKDGVVKIMDFGLAKAIDSDTTTSTRLAGTPAYMSPEQTLGQSADVRTDIYSLGLILYEMLCGKRAFAGDSAVSFAMKQLNETPVSPRQLVPDLPEFINGAVLRCIEKDRERRFASVGELRQALVSAAAETPAAEKSGASGKRKAPIFAFAAAVVVIAAIVIVLYPSRQPAEKTGGKTPGQTPTPLVLASAAPAPQAPAPAQSTGPSVAVLDFTNLQKDNQFAHLEVGIAESFTASLVRSKRFRVVERTQLAKILAELDLNQSSAVDAATAQKVGRLVGAQYLVLGSFQAFGGQTRINARLLKVETGEILQTDAVTGEAAAALSLPDTLAERFLSEIK